MTLTVAKNREALPQLAHQDELLVTASIKAAVIYAALFDYPLTIGELVKYQVGTRYDAASILAALELAPELRDFISEEDGFYFPSHRPELPQKRKARAEKSATLWWRARLYGRLAAMLPFVRMVAVTGALAVDNVGARPDIDLLVVARPGRVWICRRGLILLVRVARLLGDDLCPNYILSSKALKLDQRDFFTAHELAQMVPLSGDGLYRRMLGANRWATRYLPAAFPNLPQTGENVRRKMTISERILASRVFDKWEAWELARLRDRLGRKIGTASEVVCSAEQCKGHTGLHRQSITTTYAQKLSAAALEPVAEFLDMLNSANNVGR
ncbi:MAG TPA: hypothetical protein VM409_05050 [Chloroflexia bacterium]|nr:hypothetical protein [Chloroflexia bacterium]